MRKIALFLGMLVSVAACGTSSPTATPDQPVFDGGTLAGSGNKEDESATAAHTTPGDSTSRGGTLAGSGN